MLIEFRVANYRSLRDEQALTLEADPGLDSGDLRLRSTVAHPVPLLPVAVVYGSNASGKSNLLAALGFMREAVLLSAERWRDGQRIPRSAFAWSGRSVMPSLFEVTLALDDCKYHYGFQLDDHAILEEWFDQWRGPTRVRFFERDRQNIKCDSEFRQAWDSLADRLVPSALFLSAAGGNAPSDLGKLYGWFERMVTADGNPRLIQEPWKEAESWPGMGKAESAQPVTNGLTTPAHAVPRTIDGPAAELRRRSLNFLKSLDLGILDIKQVRSVAADGLQVLRTLVRHSEDEDSWLELADESKGTQCLIRLAPNIVQVIETGGLLLVDELESSLHPLIGSAIVGLFSNPHTNPRNAQVLFTTHDTRLLGNSLGDPVLRRDQVWFAEKDKEGASVIYPLTDFRSSDCENLERGYLQGRYGAIPYCGSFSWNEE